MPWPILLKFGILWWYRSSEIGYTTKIWLIAVEDILRLHENFTKDVVLDKVIQISGLDRYRLGDGLRSPVKFFQIFTTDRRDTP